MTRSSQRLWASSFVIFAFIACAKAEGGEPLGGDGDGDGDVSPSSGGNFVTGSGGVVIRSSGGSSAGTGGVTVLPMGGAASTGGALNLGGAGSGGDGTGGSDFDGQCAGLGGLASVTATGDRRVYTCPKVQASCTASALNVPALFECVSTHVPNCEGQTPDGAENWKFVGLCSETAMGGAEN